MTEKTDTFRLKYLFSPSYVAGRLSEIKSVSDAFGRIGKIPVYIGYRILNGCYGLIGLLIFVWRKAIGFCVIARYKTVGFFILVWDKASCLYYIVRGRWIHGKEKISNAMSRVYKAIIYSAHLVLKVCYKVRGIFMLAWSKTKDAYYAVRGLGILLPAYGKKIFWHFRQSFFKVMRRRMFVIEVFLRNAPGRIRRGATSIKNKILSLVYKLQFFGDIYRDFALKKGLAGLKPLKDVRMKRLMAVKPREQVSNKSLRSLWLTHPYCNYKCTYCWIHGARPVIEDNGGYVKRSKEEYIRGWDNFNQRYGPANIEIIGGEPFLDADLPDILSAISVKNTVSIVTNLYWDPKIIIGKVDPLKLSFLVSFHPEHEPSVDRFIGKVSALQRAGFFTVVCIVVWPPFISRLSSWLNKFYFRGISVMIEPFVGEWMGRVYPNSYTAFEKEMIKDLNFGKYILPYVYDSGLFGSNEYLKAEKDTTEIDFATSFQFANVSPKGKLCNAGVSYFRVLYNGMVRRCGHGKIFGEFFNGNFSLLDKPEPCELDKCDCLGENVCIEGGVDGPTVNREQKVESRK